MASSNKEDTSDSYRHSGSARTSSTEEVSSPEVFSASDSGSAAELGAEVSPSPPPPSSDVQPPPGYVRGLSDAFTEHVNAHIRYYRLVPWLVGSVGVALLLRCLPGPLQRLRQVADIPRQLVAENRKLTGVVAETGWNTVGVWHVPIWRWVFKWGTRPPSECLPKNASFHV